MSSHRRAFSLLGLCLWLGACATASGGGDAGGSGDASDSDGADDGSGGDAGVDVPVETGEPGGFGVTCTSGADCASGICIEALEGGLICTEFCFDTCEEGYECRLIANSAGDLVRICFPPYDDLCRECDFDRQCGGLADRCLTLLDGKFCGKDCSSDGLCPDGFTCGDLEDGGRQCMPESFVCTGCADEDGDLHGAGPDCLGRDCDETNPGIFEGAPELCDLADNDCDDEIDEDFDPQTDPMHCGGCGRACDFDFADPGCSAGTCYIAGCLPGHYDLNGNREDGCEYECTDEDFAVEDRPDPSFLDTDCDGIDGSPARAVFVAPSGDDTNPGTPQRPLRTISLAMDVVAADPFLDSVYVAEGVYFGPGDGSGGFLPIRMISGVNLYGGYEVGTWRRSTDNITRIAATSPAVIAEGLDQPTEIGGFQIEGAAGRTLPDGRGETSIGLLVRSSPGLTISNCQISGGVGGQGADAELGRVGLAGSGGGAGGRGEVDSSGLCSGNPAPERGFQGASPCGSTGGLGGSAARAGGTGGAGGGGLGPGGGGGGSGGAGGSEGFFGDSDSPGRPGTGGARGADGAPGEPGVGGAAEGDFDAGDILRAGSGASGGDGGPAGGGGGGGGGGGAYGGCGGFVDTCDGYGGAGGGGGGGGCGGHGGVGGGAGGGSFGLYVIDSPGVIVRRSTLLGAAGGNGGDGGRGGSGGNGGDPGPAGTTSCDGGVGGLGGRGGDGGDGGMGGGGAGGSSFALVTVRSSEVNLTETVLTFGAVGPGGEGGTAGAPGLQAETRNY
ncbi:MAG: DUF1565 domain-containing protein [Myxococcales bacterium]|nr:DUF1565 domain-containing protein [Myxococcales bacterium]MCB9530683.1 DUF1565 domain-containing protein [Myxococcales bacterium]MCB9533604.1 DUF1565 domain-containing protein [Myxococcales bacterium]